jgi:hypothetical protein
VDQSSQTRTENEGAQHPPYCILSIGASRMFHFKKLEMLAAKYLKNTFSNNFTLDCPEG